MNSDIRKIIREAIESTLLCEVKMDIKDVKDRGFAEELGKMYKTSLSELKPIKIHGKLGIEGPQGGDASVFEITLQNGDSILALRNTNPAYGAITINGSEFFVSSQELFANKFPELIKKYYLEYKTAKAGIPSI